MDQIIIVGTEKEFPLYLQKTKCDCVSSFGEWSGL